MSENTKNKERGRFVTLKKILAIALVFVFMLACMGIVMIASVKYLIQDNRNMFTEELKGQYELVQKKSSDNKEKSLEKEVKDLKAQLAVITAQNQTGKKSKKKGSTDSIPKVATTKHEEVGKNKAIPAISLSAKKEKKKEVVKETPNKGETIETVRAAVKLYEKPDESSRVITSLPKESILELVKPAEFGFLQVKYKGEEGFVYYYRTSYAEGRKPAIQNAKKGIHAKLKEDCVLRTAPYIDANTIKNPDGITNKKGRKGDIIDYIDYIEMVEGEVHGWLKVRLHNTNWTGYIYGDVERDTDVSIEEENEDVTESSSSPEETSDQGVKIAKGSVISKKTKTTSTSTVALVARSSAPETSTSAPVASSSAPVARSSAPETSTSAPVASSSAPETPATTAGKMTESATPTLAMKALTLETKKLNSARNKKKSARKKKLTCKITTYGVVNGRRVNLRKSPSVRSKIKGTYNRNRKLVILSRKGTWFKVQIGKVKGFMYGRYVRKTVECGEITGSEIVQKKEEDSGEKEFDIAVNTLTPVKETQKSSKTFQGVKLHPTKRYKITRKPLSRSGGVKDYKGHHETYYSEKVKPGGGLKIPGRHSNTEDGTVRDRNGYICVAADRRYMKKGSTLMTSLGPAKVYDTGCAYGTIDIYVNW